MGDGARSGFFKEETVEFKIQIQNRAFVHHIIVSSLKGIHPRHPPREFPLGLRAPVLGMVTAQILGNEPFPFLVGERILLSPVRCLGSCSLREHSAERNRAHPTRPHKPLSGFSYPCLWCRFRYDTLYCISLRRSSFSHGRLAEIPEGANAIVLAPSLRLRKLHPPVRARETHSLFLRF